MKSMARAILFTGFVAAATAAVGDKLSGAMGESDNQADANSLPAEPQASTELAVPAEGATLDVAANSSSAELQPGDSMTITPSPSTDIVAANPPPAETVAPAPRPTETVVRRVPARPAYVVTNAFPGSVDDAGNYLIAKVTHADLYANSGVMTAASAFPGSVDDAGRYLVASRTHADIFLDRTRVAQQEQRGTEASGN